ncbi:MAG TPA: alpha/beta hydrolase [Solirubrobacteraceae bacterium]|nr:alpha/beta hydrolase [Solirubrobacteraceae bacterium]
MPPSNVEFIHGTASIAPDLRIHYVEAGQGPRTCVLLHGFPQTWWEWRRVIPPLTEAGFRVVAPDYRGAGDSSRPAGGYDKRTMAEDIHRLLRDHLGIDQPVFMVGHDIGMMVAFAYAQRYPDDVQALAVADAVIPGTKVFDWVRTVAWHFAFHNVAALPEALVAGRERLYLEHFFTTFSAEGWTIADEDLDRYAAAYAQPEAIRAGFELYRAFERDAADTRDALKQAGKLTMPVLAISGAAGQAPPGMVAEMMREVAEDVTDRPIAGSGHFVPDERPAELAQALIDFAAR